MNKQAGLENLEFLISEILDHDKGGPCAENVQNLCKLLEASAEARAEYIRMISIHSMLQELQLDASQPIPNTSDAPPNVSTVGQPFSWPIVRLGGLVLILLLLLGTYATLKSFTSGPNAVIGGKPTKQVKNLDPSLFVARITQTQDAIWKNSDKLAIGQLLRPKLLELIAGNAEITFDSGAVVTLSGPCALAIDSSNGATLHSGRMWADVPNPAIGFAIHTPTAKVEDLGTRFSVEVTPNGESNVAVLEGEVRIATGENGQEFQSIVRRNEAKRIGIDSRSLVDLEFSDKWMMENQLPAFSSGEEIPYYHWKFDDADAVRSGVWVESGSHDGIRNYDASLSADSGMGQPIVKAISGPAGGAVHLNGEGGFLETEVPGVSGDKPRTICCWVRIPKEAGPEHAYSIISWGSEALGRKWQLSWNAHMYVSPGVKGAFRTEIGSGYVVGTKDLRDGEWHHIASVFLGRSEQLKSNDMRNRVRLYVDGELEPISAFLNRNVDTEVNENSFPVFIGRYIGFRSPDEEKHFQSFKGAIDELYLFEGALTPGQILKLMNEGTPPQRGEIIPVHHGV